MPPRARYPDVPYRPTLIDAAYAGLLTESNASPLVVPALNRDGDCLSDLVLALFGSIAGAESVLLALNDDLEPVGGHGGGTARDSTVPHGQERGQPDGDAPRLCRRARPRGARGTPWWPGRPPRSAWPLWARRRTGSDLRPGWGGFHVGRGRRGPPSPPRHRRSLIAAIAAETGFAASVAGKDSGERPTWPGAGASERHRSRGVLGSRPEGR